MGTLKGLIERQLSDEGYVEKASNKDLDSKTANKGSGNYTKYSRDVDSWGLMGCQGQPWCCTMQFAHEVYEYGVEKALEHWNMTRDTYVGYSCFATYNAFKKAGKVGMEPKLGAVVIFSFSHAGRVARIYSKNGQKYWDCLEGNTSADLSDRNGGQVKLKTRPWNDSSVKGFCYIDYDEDIKSGWMNDSNGWWYRYSDGSWPAGKWAWLQEETGGTWGWYLFDPDGYMLTGYQTAPNGKKYFLCPDSGINEGKCMCTSDQGELIIAEYDWQEMRYNLC